MRRRVRAALVRAGLAPPPPGSGPKGGPARPVLAHEELSLIELEMMQDMDRETRVGQMLEGARGRGRGRCCCCCHVHACVSWRTRE